jgi:N-acyl homoserine lactone hydrolase
VASQYDEIGYCCLKKGKNVTSIDFVYLCKNEGEEEMTQLRIYPLPLLKLKSLKGIVTYLANMEEPVETYASIWYIEGTKERILIDAGGSAEVMIRRGYDAEHIASPVDALKRVNLTPNEIDIVICTHLHNDHMALGHLYKNAKFIIQKRELEANFNPHPLEAPRCVSKSVLEGLDFRVIDGDANIVEGVRVLFTPGHTRGGQSVVIDTERGKVIISGLCTIRDNFEPPEPIRNLMPVIPPGIHLDVREAFDSLMRIKQEADIVVPLHDAEFALQSNIP